ncbi:MAG: hypothetical protein ACJ8G1_17535 [Vitreoscilla sp.]
MDAFKNAGGLNNQNIWHGFKALQVSTMYDSNGKLAMLEMGLINRSMEESYSQPSFNNLSKALIAECGSDWSQGGTMGGGAKPCPLPGIRAW